MRDFSFVSTTTSAALAQWVTEAKIIIGMVALAALSIVVFVALIVRKMGRGIRQSRQRLRGQKLQLDTALNNMSQGLLMCDAEGRVVLCNRHYMEIYAVPPDMVARGCTLQELVAHHFESGLLAGSAEQQMAAFLQRAALKTPIPGRWRRRTGARFSSATARSRAAFAYPLTKTSPSAGASSRSVIATAISSIG
jgi:PAS domain-containing protein